MKYTGKITKAEVLLTRRCNLRCKTCRLIRHRVKEMSLSQWKRAFDVVYDVLGGTFVALYGGEPSVLSNEFLVEIIKHLATKRSDIADFTIISNGFGLTMTRAAQFVEAGLESWTSSVDATPHALNVGDKHMRLKTQHGIKALDMMKEHFGLRDTCGIITISAKNLRGVFTTVEYLCSKGHWVGLDVLHYNRGDMEYSFSADKEELGGLVLTSEHADRLAQLADRLLDRYEELLVFPTRRVLEKWKEQDFVDLKWKCVPGHSITIDADGTLGLCDDRMPTEYGSKRKALLPRGKPWHIFDFEGENLDATWDVFLKWYKADLKRCDGCFWSTHFMAVDALSDKKLRQHYVHKVGPRDLV